MEPVKPTTTSSVAVRYGLLVGLTNIIYLFAIYALGQESNKPLGWVSLAVVPIIGIFLAHKAFKQSNAGFMSYGQGLGIGMLMMLLSGIIVNAFSYVYRTYIDPEMPGRIQEAMRNEFEATGKMTSAQIDQILATTAKFSTGILGFASGMLFILVLGLLYSLVISAFTKNAKPEFE